MVRIGRFQLLLLSCLCALALSACDGSQSTSDAVLGPAVSTSCGTGTGSLAINNNSGESVTVNLLSGSASLPALTIANGASVTAAEPLGTLQVTATGDLTGNSLIQASPSIVCGNTSSLTISPEPSYALNVSTIGQGWVALVATTGTIQCLSGSTSACSQTFLKNLSVTLTATAQSGSVFSGWSGACTGSTDVCTVAMSQAQNVTAQFSPIDSPLDVILSGNGQGAVVSNPSDISCGNIPGTVNTTCSAGLDDGSIITLTATAAPGSQFAGWNGFCLGQSGNTCQVEISQSTIVSAQFSLLPEQLNLSLTGSGTGVVEGGSPAPGNPYPAYCASPGDSAPAYQGQDCSPSFNFGTLVTLTAQPDTGMVFSGWSGACSGSATTCTVPMSQTQNVTAQFDLAPEGIQVSLSGPGQGSVTSQPSGINCSSAGAGGCNANFNYGTSVTLTAAASSGSYFSGWTSGPCMGSSAATCTFSAQPGMNISADFEALNPIMLSVSGPGVIDVEGTSTSCQGSCSVAVQPGQQVTLQEGPPTGSIWASLNSVFIGWGGLCTGTSLTCTLSFEQIQAAGGGATVSAQFGYPVFLATSGTGLGVVASNIPGLTCAGSADSTCAGAPAVIGQTVTLVAGAETGSVFAGWVSGPCAGSSSPTCNFTVSGIVSPIKADFEIPEALSVSVSGPNALQITYNDPLGHSVSEMCSSAGESACSQSIPENTVVTLAIPSSGQSKGNYSVTWGGACAGTSGTSCQVTMNQAQTVTMATPYVDYMTLIVSGSGSVFLGYTDPSGAVQNVTCSATCTFEAWGGSQVNVSAFAGSTVQSWQGVQCSGQTCTFPAPSDGTSMNFGVNF